MVPVLAPAPLGDEPSPGPEVPLEEQARRDLVFIRNSKSGMLHRRLVDELNSNNILWRCRCGWSYGKRSFERAPRTFQGPKCPKCFRPSATQAETESTPAPESLLVDPEVESSSEESAADSSDSSSS